MYSTEHFITRCGDVSLYILNLASVGQKREGRSIVLKCIIIVVSAAFCLVVNRHPLIRPWFWSLLRL